jgi:hypothetical protein
MPRRRSIAGVATILVSVVVPAYEAALLRYSGSFLCRSAGACAVNGSAATEPDGFHELVNFAT